MIHVQMARRAQQKGDTHIESGEPTTPEYVVVGNGGGRKVKLLSKRSSLPSPIPIIRGDE